MAALLCQVHEKDYKASYSNGAKKDPVFVKVCTYRVYIYMQR